MNTNKLHVRKSLVYNREHRWVVDNLNSSNILRRYINEVGELSDYWDYPTKIAAQTACDLYVELTKPEPERTFVEPTKQELEVKDTSIRTFDTGATRDTVQGKLSYVRILSPIVLRRYVEYMNFHAKQSDGTMREPDNWKSGFPIETYLDSLGRHLVAVWLLQQDFTETDNHGSVTLEDSLCGIIFNAMGWLHEILKTKLPPNKVELDYQAAVEHETGALETVPGYGGDVDAR